MISFLSDFDRWLTRSLYDPTRQSVLLRKIVDRIRNSLELKVVLQTAADEVAKVLHLDRCLFFWYLPEMQRVEVVCEHVTGEKASYLGYYPLARFGAAAPLIAEGKLVMTGTAALPKWVTFAPHRLSNRLSKKPQPSFQFFESRASLLVPVSGQDGAIGFIACLSDHSRRWSAPEVEFIQSIAQQLEIGIRQAQLYEQTQKQAQREQLVNQITTQTRQSLDVNTILTQAIAQLLEALQVDRCLVHLVEASPDEQDDPTLADSFDRAVFRRKHLFEVCRSPFPPSIDDFDTNGPITQWVIQHRQQVVIPDITQDDRIGSDNAEYQLAQIKSSLVIPVQANGTLQAILYLNQCSHVRCWSKDDQTLAQAVADQLALSIQQGHLYARMQQQAIESATQARELAEAIDELQHTQAQLIQSEKMSSLGQMVAGVAHEINNPISFIYGNIPYVERYVQDLLRLLEGYQAQYPQAIDEMQDLTREVELDFLLQDLPRILKSLKSGAGRIRQIVQTLRCFSRLDEAHCQLTDLHEGLDNTLDVLKNYITPDIQVIRNDRAIPKVECYPRLLNQVFINVLMNAIDAFQSCTHDKTITITTDTIVQAHDSWVRVAIADNGCGIPHNIQPKVFDPFFTTKEVGQGTGLGLAVCYQTIVNQHNGKIYLRSEPGQGSEFVIEIPVKHTALRFRKRNLRISEGKPDSQTRSIDFLQTISSPISNLPT